MYQVTDYGKVVFAALILVTGVNATATPVDDEDEEELAIVVPAMALDTSDVHLPTSVRKGNFVAVPIPFSNPTLENGLIGMAGYFHPQSEAQKATQPPSVSGIGAMYTSNESWGVALGHSAYWNEDRWRFTGVLGYADVTLPLLISGGAARRLEINWLLDGTLVYTSLSRRFGGHWYAGLVAQYLSIDQEFSVDFVAPDFVLGNETQSVAMGPSLTYDTRDVPANAYEGRYFKATAIVNDEVLGSDLDYVSYSAGYKSYHQLHPSLVAAWEIHGCLKTDGFPLWNACGIGLRGFASTDYLGRSSWRAQAELRWQFRKRWGAAVFGGAGQITESLVSSREHDIIPSYGAGLRFTVQPEQRIVMRLDYGRSTDSDAWYLAVGQAF